MDAGFKAAQGQLIQNPLPKSWLGLASAPTAIPSWVTIDNLSSTQVTNLQAQIGYDQSRWNYNKIGNNNQLGKYQLNTVLLESYGLLATGSNAAYGTNCVGYQQCWRPVYVTNNSYQFENYFYNITSLQAFLSNTVAQEHLAYQRLVDIFVGLTAINAITPADTADIVAGMIYVGWTLGVGTSPTGTNSAGTGAYAWRYYGFGDGINSFNSGRYSVTGLS